MSGKRWPCSHFPPDIHVFLSLGMALPRLELSSLPPLGEVRDDDPRSCHKVYWLTVETRARARHAEQSHMEAQRASGPIDHTKLHESPRL